VIVFRRKPGRFEMKTENKHTPPPWVQDGHKVKGGEYQTESIDVSLSGKSSGVKTVTTHRLFFRTLHEEDAAFIVRAVNSHEALLEAAKLGLSFLRSDYRGK
jgi:hypothetical protein